MFDLFEFLYLGIKSPILESSVIIFSSTRPIIIGVVTIILVSDAKSNKELLSTFLILSYLKVPKDFS